ncbi:MAG: ATP-binding protein, partial [Flavobacterium sp.]|nr:ATP-binding protein [Flavobacterium sp.]
MIGREDEITLLKEKYASEKSEFIALYGRRRVGKTYLVRETFKDKINFQLTGIANATLQ